MRQQLAALPEGDKDALAEFGMGYATEQCRELIKAGVPDPTKVARTALENAASISGLMLTTQAVISDKPEDEKAAPPMPGGMPGGMGGMY